MTLGWLLALVLAVGPSESAPDASATPEEAAAPVATPAPVVISGPATSALPEPVVDVKPAKVATGGVGLIRVDGLLEGDSVTGTVKGQAVPFHAGPGLATALFGVDLDVAPGKMNVRVHVKRKGKTISKVVSVTVFDGKYPEQKFTVPPEKDSSDDPELGKRISREAKAIAAIWPAWSAERHWSGAFVPPAAGPLKNFGNKRIINGKPRRPHSGADLPGKLGDPILASADGKVVFIEDQFFGGITTVVDHGQGLYSMYMHQSKASLKVGDPVKKGEKVGEVGSTGRSTGPHLHWGLRLHGARVDPAKLLELGPALDAIPGATSAGGAATPAATPMTAGTAGTPASGG